MKPITLTPAEFVKLPMWTGNPIRVLKLGKAIIAWSVKPQTYEDSAADAVIAHLSAQAVEGEVESLAEHDKQVAAKALKDAAQQIIHKQHAESVRQMLLRRAASIEQAEAE